MGAEAQLIEREQRWAMPAAIAAMAGVALIIAANFVLAGVGGDGEAEFLRSADREGGTVILSSLLSALGFTLLAAPLVYLFQAALGRSDRMRGQLIGVVVAAPLFLAASAGLTGVVTENAASDFVAGNVEAEIDARDAAPDCREERNDVDAEAFREEYGAGGIAACTRSKVEDDAGQRALEEASLQPLAFGFQLGGRLGMAVALLYTCLHAMRIGLLTRFWGSLGMAVGAIAFLLPIFTLVFFIYLGLLIAGWVPGGRPPAWAAGRAISWPAPGEEPPEEEALPGSGRELDEGEDRPPANPARQRGERRKRKRRQ